MSDERFELGGDGHCGDAPLYMLGLLRADEAQSFLRHGEACVVCRDEMAALVPAIDALAESAPPVRAPGRVRTRVLATARAEAAAAEAISEARVSRERQGGRWLARRWQPRQFALIGGSCATLAAGCALGALVIASPDSPKTTTLSAQVSIRGASATLHRSGSHTWLTISNMPQPGRNRVYEVWLRRGGNIEAAKPTSALFTPTASGDATVAVPGNLEGVGQVMVTAEPAGGSLSPTREPVIVARV